ncbi:MAG: 3-methyl-2-oxobutanoate dehydrogenase subunit VorB [Spirochaetaceae bacterium]|jgi:2-oxoglutarate ferredoxin oxidoreductase subunit alpha|nr:3-methyl-2-oxobutanoate dehydrogenase subunit VorB [Spirochaetaceae bacterium]
MNDKVLMKGNEAIGEAAIRAGCGAYFGYPITPQNEITGYMAKHLLDKGRIFIQAESETAAINMVYGASCAGVRAMTSSSSPGISLKQEGMSYAAGADVPLVLVNVVRGGPGLGNIAPSQADYFQSTRGGGHGDYYCIVLAPKSVQEAADFTYEAFDLADKYRIPVIVQADGMIGQMMEALVLPAQKSPQDLPVRSWIVGNMGKAPHESRAARHITSIHLVPEELEAVTKTRFNLYDKIKAAETRYEYAGPGKEGTIVSGNDAACGTAVFDAADIILAAYGTSARVCLGAKQLAEKAGVRVGLFRPITLWPFPYKALGQIAAAGKPILTVEMSLGQMVEDVKLAVLEIPAETKRPDVHLLGHTGGVIPTEEEVFAEIKRICR